MGLFDFLSGDYNLRFDGVYYAVDNSFDLMGKRRNHAYVFNFSEPDEEFNYIEVACLGTKGHLLTSNVMKEYFYFIKDPKNENAVREMNDIEFSGFKWDRSNRIEFEYYAAPTLNSSGGVIYFDGKLKVNWILISTSLKPFGSPSKNAMFSNLKFQFYPIQSI